MKFFSSLTITTLTLTNIVFGQEAFYKSTRVGQCRGGSRLRPSIYAISDSQWSKYTSAISELNSGSRPTKWDQLAKLHTEIYPTIHSKASFFAWHRGFLYILEHELQKIDPSVMIPYWDWTVYSQNPENDPAFSKRRFGGDGNPKNDNYIEDGSFKDFEVYYDGSSNRGKDHLLRRQFDKADGALSSWLSPDVINGMILESKDFKNLWSQIESGPHGVIHNSIGADFSGHASPSDPLFFSHHAFVDKLWYDWTKRFPEHKHQYATDDTVPSVDAPLNSFSFSVSDVLDPEESLCYGYAQDHYSWTPISKNSDSQDEVEKEDGKQNRTRKQTREQESKDQEGSENQNRTRNQRSNGTRGDEREEESKIKRREYQVTSPEPSSNSYMDALSRARSHAQIIANQAYTEVECSDPKSQAQYDFDYVMSGVTAPSSTDRTDLTKLRVPKPQPVEYLERMGCDIPMVRQLEKSFALFTSALNRDKSFISTSALINKDKLAKLPPPEIKGKCKKAST